MKTALDPGIKRAAQIVRESRARLPKHLRDLPVPPRPDSECEELR